MCIVLPFVYFPGKTCLQFFIKLQFLFHATVILTSCCAQKKDLEAEVLGDGIYFSTTAFRSRGKGHLTYYMRLLHSDSLALSFQLSSRRRWSGLYSNPYNAWGLSMDAWTIQLDCQRHVA